MFQEKSKNKLSDLKRILITGTSGFLGAVLKEHYESLGYDVYGTTGSKLPSSKQEIQIDISSPDAISKLWNIDFPIIIHTVGIINYTEPKSKFYAVNLNGTKHILSYAKAHNCQHFIQLSSIAVYGIPIGQNRSELNSSIQPKSKVGGPYTVTKSLAEIAIKESGIPYSILRLPTMIGKVDTTSTGIIRRIRAHEVVTSGTTGKLVSVMNARNLGPLIDQILIHGPLNAAYNTISDVVLWEEIVDEYGRLLNIPVNSKKKSLFSIFFRWNDKVYHQFLFYSRFGSHFPHTELEKIVGPIKFPKTWKDGAKEAVNFILDSEPN